VLFDYDKATLRRDAAAAVAKLVALLEHRYPGAPATITGYTDSSGAADYNLSLSHARAAAVAAALVARGISSERLSITGRGASDFIASNETVAGRQANRRVEITLSVE
jgi:outer membrane protein OmpA-like peptidoglycan-associated protein